MKFEAECSSRIFAGFEVEAKFSVDEREVDAVDGCCVFSEPVKGIMNESGAETDEVATDEEDLDVSA